MGCSHAPARPATTAADARGRATGPHPPKDPHSFARLLRSETGLTFEVPDSLPQKVESDELQITLGQDARASLSLTGSLPDSFDQGMAELQANDANFATAQNATVERINGFTVKHALGTRGPKHVTWMLLVFDAGQKGLQFTATGPELNHNMLLKHLLLSVRRAQPGRKP